MVCEENLKQHLTYSNYFFRRKDQKTKKYPTLKEALLSFISSGYETDGTIFALLADDKKLEELSNNLKRENLSSDSTMESFANFRDLFCYLSTKLTGFKHEVTALPEIWFHMDGRKLIFLGYMSEPKTRDIARDMLLKSHGGTAKESGIYIFYEQYSNNAEKPLPLTKWVASVVEKFISEELKILESPALLTWGDPAIDKAIVCLDDKERYKHAQLGTPIPHWREFLSRISDPYAFMAWTWSLFSGEKQSRQVCWITGGGNDGKSTVANVYIHFLQGISTSFSFRSSKENQFTGSKFFRKRLVVVPDVKNEFILENDLVFQVTGGDTIDIEQKGRDSFSSKVNAHFFMASNFSPVIDVYSKAYKSRLLYFKVKPVKATENESEIFSDCRFEEKLKEEFYAYLAHCEKAYLTLCPQGERIPISEKMSQDIASDCKHPVLHIIEKFCREQLEFGKDIIVSRDALRRPFKKYLRGFEYTDLCYTYLRMLTNYLTVVNGVTIEGPFFKGVGFRQDTNEVDSDSMGV